jgi:hypothetical protein
MEGSVPLAPGRSLGLGFGVERHLGQEPELGDFAIPQVIEVNHLRGDALPCRALRLLRYG